MSLDFFLVVLFVKDSMTDFSSPDSILVLNINFSLSKKDKKSPDSTASINSKSKNVVSGSLL